MLHIIPSSVDDCHVRGARAPPAAPRWSTTPARPFHFDCLDDSSDVDDDDSDVDDDDSDVDDSDVDDDDSDVDDSDVDDDDSAVFPPHIDACDARAAVQLMAVSARATTDRVWDFLRAHPHLLDGVGRARCVADGVARRTASAICLVVDIFGSASPSPPEWLRCDVEAVRQLPSSFADAAVLAEVVACVSSGTMLQRLQRVHTTVYSVLQMTGSPSFASSIEDGLRRALERTPTRPSLIGTCMDTLILRSMNRRGTFKTFEGHTEWAKIARAVRRRHTHDEDEFGRVLDLSVLANCDAGDALATETARVAAHTALSRSGVDSAYARGAMLSLTAPDLAAALRVVQN
jgi:hypothetical protein